MSDTLRRLLQEWETEKMLHKIQAERYLTSVRVLCDLNKLINNQAKEEGISLTELGRT